MIVHECDWCGVQSKQTKPDSWADVRLNGGENGLHRRYGNSVTLWEEEHKVICTSCVTALQVFIKNRRSEVVPAGKVVPDGR